MFIKKNLLSKLLSGIGSNGEKRAKNRDGERAKERNGLISQYSPFSIVTLRSTRAATFSIFNSQLDERQNINVAKRYNGFSPRGAKRNNLILNSYHYIKKNKSNIIIYNYFFIILKSKKI
jgi:hypothetical protein